MQGFIELYNYGRIKHKDSHLVWIAVLLNHACKLNILKLFSLGKRNLINGSSNIWFNKTMKYLYNAIDALGRFIFFLINLN